jgi:hypothetical protein
MDFVSGQPLSITGINSQTYRFHSYLVLLAFFSLIVFFSDIVSFRPIKPNFPHAHVTYSDHFRDALLVYAICPVSSANNVFPAWKFRIPTFNINCDPTKIDQSCDEAVRYLNFLINGYDHPPAKRYMFVHGHERIWHSPRFIW